MRKINKGAEPAEWLEYRLTPGVDYQAIPALRESLLKEQGYICAYCMRRIPHRDNNSNEDSRIDHMKSRSGHPDLKLDYRNMVICCPGAINNDFHCDKKKDEESITFDLFCDEFINTLSYQSSDGTIKSSNVAYDNEINKYLNLNNALLKQNRLQVLTAVINKLGKKSPWAAADIKRLISEWDTMQDGKFYAYNGIVLWYLKKKLKTARP